MGRSVHISTQIPPPLSRVKHLGISRARQEQLIAIIEQTVERLKLEDSERERLKLEEAKAEEDASVSRTLRAEMVSGSPASRKKQEIAVER